jgi:hypothetical protein
LSASGEAPAARSTPIAIARGNCAQYYDLRSPATLPPAFHELCVQFEIGIGASERGRAGFRPGARSRLNRVLQAIDIKAKLISVSWDCKVRSPRNFLRRSGDFAAIFGRLHLNSAMHCTKQEVIRVFEFESTMLKTHKFQIGQTVCFTSRPIGHMAVNDAYLIVKLLPSDGEDYQYRIKSANEAFERVAKESQLDRY